MLERILFEEFHHGGSLAESKGFGKDGKKKTWVLNKPCIKNEVALIVIAVSMWVPAMFEVRDNTWRSPWHRSCNIVSLRGYKEEIDIDSFHIKLLCGVRRSGVRHC